MEPQISDRQDLQREFGLYLKAQRERKRITLDEASKTLRISEDNLRSLEKGNFSKLPRMPFVLGLVNSYGRYIGCEITQLQQKVAELKPLLPPHAALDTVGKPNDPQLMDVHKPSFYVTQKMIVMVASVLVLAIGVWVILGVFSPEITRLMNTPGVGGGVTGTGTGTDTSEDVLPAQPANTSVSNEVQKWENPVPATVPNTRE